jgi:hypothetical protein
MNDDNKIFVNDNTDANSVIIPFINKDKVLNQILKPECVKFYYGKQERMFKDDCKFYVACDISSNGIKCYKGYHDVDEFLRFYNNVSINERFFYEIFTDKVNEVYDIDLKNSSLSTIEIIDKLQTLRYDFLLSNGYTHWSNDIWYILNSSDATKTSLHIVIRNGYVFRNMHEHRSYIDDFLEYHKNHNEDVLFDKSIYTSNRCFRILGSTKFGQDRYFRKHRDSKYNCQNYDTKLFYGSYIDNDHILIDVKSSVGKVVPKRNFTTNDTDIEDIKKLLDMLNDGRSDDYKDWYAIEQVIYNIHGENGFELLDDFSKLSSSYDPEKVLKHWNGLRKTTSTIGTLRYYAQQDNPDAYDKWCKERSQCQVETIEKSTDFFNIINAKGKFMSDDEKQFLTDYSCKSMKRVFNEIQKKQYTTPPEKQYLKFMYDNNCSEILDDFFDLHTSCIEKDNDYVDGNDYLSPQKCIITKAPLGKGKTTAVVKYFNEQHYETIIVLTPRRTFAQSITTRFNAETKYCFKNYDNIKTQYIQYKYIVIQVESLYRLDLNFYKNGLVIIDEVESCLFQMSSFETHKANIRSNINSLNNLMKQSNKIICLDAFLTARSTGFFQYLDIDYIVYTYTTHNIKRVAYEVETHAQLCSKIIDKIKDGKKVFCVIASKKKLKEHFEPTIRSFVPTVKMLCYHGDCSDEEKDMSDIQKWKDYDVILTTTTISVGCNYDSIIDMFDSLFCYANNKCAILRDIFQALYRVRHIKDNELFFCIENFGYNQYFTNINQVDNKITFKNKTKKEQFQRVLKEEHHVHYDWYEFVHKYNLIEQKISTEIFKPLFYEFLKKCNYELKDLEQDIIDIDLEMIEPVFIDYNLIDEVTMTEYIDLHDKKKKTPKLFDEMDNAKYQKGYFQWRIFDCIGFRNSYGDENRQVEKLIWDIYNNYNKKKFVNLSYELGLCKKNFNIHDIVRKKLDNQVISTTDDLCIKLEFIQDLKHIIGIQNTCQLAYNIPPNKMDKLEQFFNDKNDVIKNYFDKSFKSSDKISMSTRKIKGILNTILSGWGVTKTKAKSKRTQVKGVRKMESTLEIVNDSTMKDKNDTELPNDVNFNNFIIPREKL